jgi:hypothetical protein
LLPCVHLTLAFLPHSSARAATCPARAPLAPTNPPRTPHAPAALRRYTLRRAAPGCISASAVPAYPPHARASRQLSRTERPRPECNSPSTCVHAAPPPRAYGPGPGLGRAWSVAGRLDGTCSSHCDTLHHNLGGKRFLLVFFSYAQIFPPCT